MIKELTECLCCSNSGLSKVLDLGRQPLANNYLTTPIDHESTYPLAINFCSTCCHVQLTHAVDPDLLFKNYLYVSGTTQTLKDYFAEFVNIVNQYSHGRRVLDIACNDGSQLDAFKKQGYETYGIDPAENLYPLSSKNHNVVCSYFDSQSISQFNDKKFDIIVAQNVFAHNSYPKQFLELGSQILNDSGKIFIQTSQADMIINNQFDTIYHEHISFFSVRSMLALARRAGLYLQDVIRTPVHGTSFVFVLSKHGPELSPQQLEQEQVLTDSVMNQYAENCHRIARETKSTIDHLIEQGYTIIGYGAAAKGNTFINYAGIDNLSYIIDDNPLKVGLFVPGVRIPICSLDKLVAESGRVCVVPLAWNFFDEIKTRVSNACAGSMKELVYLKYFPKVELIYA